MSDEKQDTPQEEPQEPQVDEEGQKELEKQAEEREQAAIEREKIRYQFARDMRMSKDQWDQSRFPQSFMEVEVEET